MTKNNMEQHTEHRYMGHSCQAHLHTCSKMEIIGMTRQGHACVSFPSTSQDGNKQAWADKVMHVFHYFASLCVADQSEATRNTSFFCCLCIPFLLSNAMTTSLGASPHFHKASSPLASWMCIQEGMLPYQATSIQRESYPHHASPAKLKKAQCSIF